MNCQAILVNYHCSELIRNAVCSLSSIDGLRIDVVDNSVSDEEQKKLIKLIPSGVNLTVSDRNLGFAGACNLAFSLSDTDFVLLLNPDAQLMPGALQQLISTLVSDPNVAAVSPRVYWDTDHQFLMPLSTFPSRATYIRTHIGRNIPQLTRRYMLKQRMFALQSWQSKEPFAVEALSGGHMLLRRSAVVTAGGLFDESFFMYWEDSDLVWRLQENGFKLLQDPRAEAIHFYTHSPAKEKLIGEGWSSFEQKHYSGWFWRAINWLGRVFPPARVNTSFSTIQWPSGDSLILDVPPRLRSDWVLELSPAPDFLPAIGYRGRGAQAAVQVDLLRRFANCKIFMRLGNLYSDSLDSMEHFLIEIPSENPQEIIQN